MDRNNSNDRATAGAISATAIIASIALLALTGLGGVSCAVRARTPEETEARLPGLWSWQRV